MEHTKLIIASASTIRERLAELAANQDPCLRITGFDAVRNENGKPVFALQVDRKPDAGYEGRINGGKVIVTTQEGADDKIREMAADPEKKWQLAFSKLLYLPGKLPKGAKEEETAPETLHVAMLFLA